MEKTPLITLSMLLLSCGLCQAAKHTITWTTQGTAFAEVTAACGDTMSFEWGSGLHNLLQVPSKTCSSASIVHTWAGTMTAPATVSVPLTAAGTTHYICSVGNHCSGQNMIITVTTTCAAATAPSPPPPRSPPPKPTPPPPRVAPSPPPPVVMAPSPAPARSPPSVAGAVVHNVTWLERGTAYAPIHAHCGDSLMFNWAGFHDVVQLPHAGCDASVVTKLWYSPASAGPLSVVVPLTKSGTTYYICTVPTHCAEGHMALVVHTSCGGRPPPPPHKKHAAPCPRKLL